MEPAENHYESHLRYLNGVREFFSNNTDTEDPNNTDTEDPDEFHNNTDTEDPDEFHFDFLGSKNFVMPSPKKSEGKMKCRECESAIPELDINQRFGKGLAVLGSGTYGIVTLHNDRETGKQVVIKSSKNKQNDDQLAADVVREISSLAALQGHPNIVKFIGCRVHTTQLTYVKKGENNTEKDETLQAWTTIVLEKAEDSLHGYLLKGNFADAAEREKRRSFMYQILLGMHWMHINGIWHRDLKPQNLLVSDGDERIAVTDFGLAKGGPFQWVNVSNNVFTLWYRAPEVLIQGLVSGPARYGAAADVWSVGMVFWDMFTASGSRANPAKIDYLRGDNEGLQIWKYFRAFPSDGIVEELGVNEDKFIARAAASMMEKSKQFATLDDARLFIARTITPSKNSRKILQDALRYTLEDGEWELLEGLTRMNPSKRMTLEQALKHPYFAGVKLPFDLGSVPTAPKPIPPPMTCAQFGTELTKTLWTNIVDWLYSVTNDHDLQPASLFLGLHILRCYLADGSIHKRARGQLQSAAALWLGALYQEDVRLVPDADDWNYLTDNSFPVSEFVVEQKRMFLAVGARLHLPSSWIKVMELIEQNHTPEQIKQIDLPRRRCLKECIVAIEAMPSSFDLTETQIAQLAYDVCFDNGEIRPALRRQIQLLQDELEVAKERSLGISTLDGYQALQQATIQ